MDYTTYSLESLYEEKDMYETNHEPIPQELTDEINRRSSEIDRTCQKADEIINNVKSLFPKLNILV